MLDFYEYLGAAISIHAAREGGDMPARYEPVSSSGFQSTPPVKAATLSKPRTGTLKKYFNPRRP